MPDIRELTAREFGTADSSPAAADVRRIAQAASRHDGVDTLNEHTRLALKHRGLHDARLWIANAGVGQAGSGEGTPIGFALRQGDDLDLVVHPDERGQGVGSQLALVALHDLPRVQSWSHSDHPAAARLAARFGIPRSRELHLMTRPTSRPLPQPSAPDGIRIRAFEPRDRDGLLAVNASAFAHHPEQGEMSAADFEERAREPWFDPEGLLVAVRADDPDATLLGFHWTKVHAAQAAESPDQSPGSRQGEVYVVAVSPAAAGQGLGKVLTVAGLDHLARTGVGEVILYVDADNDRAVALYRGLGFEIARTEVQYSGSLSGA